MTTNLLLNYPKYFTCGVAGGPVTNWSSYEVMYTDDIWIIQKIIRKDI